MDEIKNNSIAIYIFSRTKNFWAEFPNVHVSNVSINEVRNGDAESLVVYTKDIDFINNYRIYDCIKKSILWLSPEPEDIIETDYAIFWLPESNYEKAYDILMNKILNKEV